MTIRTSKTELLDENAVLDLELITGARYAIGMGGTFGGGTVTAAFIDGQGKSVPIPDIGKQGGVTDPATFTEPGILEIPALTGTLRLTLAGATTPSIGVTATHLSDKPYA